MDSIFFFICVYLRSSAAQSILSAFSPDDQAHGFIAKALAPEDQLWSKAGWTSTARHDSTYVETADGLRIILVIFTTGHSRNREILPMIAGKAIEALRGVK